MKVLCNENWKCFVQTTTCFHPCLDQFCCNYQPQHINMLCVDGDMLLDNEIYVIKAVGLTNQIKIHKTKKC